MNPTVQSLYVFLKDYNHTVPNISFSSVLRWWWVGHFFSKFFFLFQFNAATHLNYEAAMHKVLSDDDALIYCVYAYGLLALAAFIYIPCIYLTHCSPLRLVLLLNTSSITVLHLAGVRPAFLGVCICYLKGFVFAFIAAEEIRIAVYARSGESLN